MIFNLQSIERIFNFKRTLRYNQFINFKSHSLSIVSLSNHSLINPDFDDRHVSKKTESGSKAYFKINKIDDKLLNKKSESNVNFFLSIKKLK